MREYRRPAPVRFAVVGAGAIGLYYGTKLAWRGRDVRFLMRSDYAQAKRFGVRVLSKEGGVSARGPFFFQSTEEIGPVDVVIIGLKTTANPALVQLLPPLLKPDSWLLTLQNGLGNEDWLAQTFRTDRVLGGLCFVCLNRKEPAVVEHLGYGQITLGDHARFPRPFVHDLCFDFRSCGVPCRPVADLHAARWEKLAWNIPFNGLCIAAGGVPVSTVLGDPGLKARARVLMEEVVAGARACGCSLPSSLPTTLLDKTKAMGPYRPSSLIDYEAGRTVELESIWAEPLRRARAAGLELPALAALYEELQAKETGVRQG